MSITLSHDDKAALMAAVAGIEEAAMFEEDRPELDAAVSELSRVAALIDGQGTSETPSYGSRETACCTDGLHELCSTRVNVNPSDGWHHARYEPCSCQCHEREEVAG